MYYACHILISYKTYIFLYRITEYPELGCMLYVYVYVVCVSRAVRLHYVCMLRKYLLYNVYPDHFSFTKMLCWLLAFTMPRQLLSVSPYCTSTMRKAVQGETVA